MFINESETESEPAVAKQETLCFSLDKGLAERKLTWP